MHALFFLSAFLSCLALALSFALHAVDAMAKVPAWLAGSEQGHVLTLVTIPFLPQPAVAALRRGCLADGSAFRW